MEKNDIFTFTAPNGVEVKGIVINLLNAIGNEYTFLCYGQNKLFTIKEYHDYYRDEETGALCEQYQNSPGELLVDYCILPDYDKILEG